MLNCRGGCAICREGAGACRGMKEYLGGGVGSDAQAPGGRYVSTALSLLQVKLARLDSSNGGAAPLGGRSGCWDGGWVPLPPLAPLLWVLPGTWVLGARCHLAHGASLAPAAAVGCRRTGTHWLYPGEGPRRCHGAGRCRPKVPRAQPGCAEPARFMICPAHGPAGAPGLDGTLSQPSDRCVGLHP